MSPCRCKPLPPDATPAMRRFRAAHVRRMGRLRKWTDRMAALLERGRLQLRAKGIQT